MNTADLIPRVRETAFLATNAVDYTDARICREMTDMLRSVFSKMVVKSKGGYWLRFDQMTTTVGQPYIRMPARACAGGLHSIQIALDAGENYIPIEERNEKQALTYQLGLGQTDVPVRYTLRGDRIVLFPTPNAVYKLRVFYYLQPPLLTPLTSPNNGLIVTATPGTRTYVTAAVAQLWQPTLLSSQNLTTGFRGEIVRDDGWCEVVGPAELVTLTTLTYVMSGTSDETLVQNGDYIVAEGQSPFPPLPEEYQRLLADMTAAEICRQRRRFDAQQAIEEKCGGTLLSFKDHIQPRADAGAEVISWQNVYTDAFPRRQRTSP
jgi:hypothetical protein